jgi:hypothetical protein
MNRIYDVRWLLLLLTISWSIAYPTTPRNLQPPEPPSWRTLTSDYLESVSIDGPFDIELIHSTTQNRAEIFANEEELKQLDIDATGNTLNMGVNPRYSRKGTIPARWLVRIYTSNLNRLSLYGSANLTARSLDCPNLIVEAADDSQVYVRGEVGIFQLLVPEGDPYIDISRVNSRDLLIEADGGTISLAGATQFMDARLAGDAHLNAKYLRVNKIWIQTTDNALAEVVVTRTLRAFADANSNVLFYNRKPKYLTDVTQISGNVLQIGYWN